jgi:hypothetical protein
MCVEHNTVQMKPGSLWMATFARREKNLKCVADGDPVKLVAPQTVAATPRPKLTLIVTDTSARPLCGFRAAELSVPPLDALIKSDSF